MSIRSLQQAPFVLVQYTADADWWRLFKEIALAGDPELIIFCPTTAGPSSWDLLSTLTPTPRRPTLMILDLSRLLSWDTSPDASSCPPSFAPRGCDYHAPDDLDHALEILTRLLSSSPRSRVTIAIDSLDPFLLLLGPQRVFAFLSSLGTVTKDRDTARVVVAHRKTPYDFSARVDEAAALERIANGVAGLETLEEWVRRQGRSGRALFATTTGWDVAECVVMKKSGRSVRETLAYRRARNGVVLKGIDDIKSVAAVQEVPKSDPSANLTFNLRLTETQQEARAKHQLELPYFDAQAGSTIAFEAEAFDDDEFDPDDDLDI